MGARWGFFAGGDPDDDRNWFGGGTGGELSLTRDVGGPFRTEDGPCGADRAGLRMTYGVPGELVDDVLVWWTDYERRPEPTSEEWEREHRRREDALWRRLRAAVPRDVWVQPADYVPHPVQVRMFIDADQAFWPLDVGWPPRPAFDEEALPAAQALLDRIQAWVDEHTAIESGTATWSQAWADHHDRRGHALSVELQADLGDGFRVEYGPHTRALRQALKKERALGRGSDRAAVADEGRPHPPQ